MGAHAPSPEPPYLLRTPEQGRISSLRVRESPRCAAAATTRARYESFAAERAAGPGHNRIFRHKLHVKGKTRRLKRQGQTTRTCRKQNLVRGSAHPAAGRRERRVFPKDRPHFSEVPSPDCSVESVGPVGRHGAAGCLREGPTGGGAARGSGGRECKVESLLFRRSVIVVSSSQELNARPANARCILDACVLLATGCARVQRIGPRARRAPEARGCEAG